MKYCVFIAVFCGVFAAVKQCDMTPRPVVCPLIYGPVCCTKTDGTRQTYDNYCTACADVSVVSYTEGSGCNGEAVQPPDISPPLVSRPSSPSYTYCKQPRPQICTKEYMPVCGIKRIGEPVTYGNGCSACGDKEVVAWISGDCNSQINTCTGNEIDCSRVRIAAKPSCGFKAGSPYSDASNAVCCIGTSYSQILPFKCPTAPAVPSVPSPSFTKCGLYRKGIMCTMIYKPVCALLKDGTQQTEGNSCTACTNMNVVGYTSGACGGRDGTNSVIDPLPPIVDPLPPVSSSKFTMCRSGPRQQVCNRMYLQTCGFKYNGLPSNYGNTCTACADSKVFGYIVGDCSDLVKTCPENRLDCRLVKAPYIESCAFQNGKAPETVSNNLCCQDLAYDQVITGVCRVLKQSGKHTLCPAKRSRLCTRIYKPVCGYTEDKVNHSTYSNSCEACANLKVSSYVDGQC